MDKLKLTWFEVFSLFWISWGTLALLSAICGIFSQTILIIIFLALAALLLYFYHRQKIIITATNRQFLAAFIVTLIIGITLSWHTTPTIFGGRDEGSYSNAAILLAQDHGLEHSRQLVGQFFNIYGPGKALNFPGFYYTPVGELKSQFLPGFISFLAIFYELFGLRGLALANLLPLLTFSLSFYLVLGKLLRKESFLSAATDEFIEKKRARPFSAIGLALLLTTFPLVLMYKFTLSEIFFASLIWFAFYLMLRYFENKTFANYLLIFIPFPLMLFSRIESLGFVAVLLGILILKDFNHLRQARFQSICALLGLVTAASLAYNSNFYIDTAKNIFEPFIKSAPSQPSSNSVLSDDLKNFYLPRVMFTYNLLPYLLMGGVYILYLFKKKRLRLLIPFIFFAPTLIYLIDANISLDHPWMLRRFLFSVIPLFLLYSALFLHDVAHSNGRWKNLRFAPYAIILLMLFINLSLIFPRSSTAVDFITFSQNPHLLSQTADIASRLGDNDLLLVSQQSSGSGWSLLSEPLRNIYGQQAVYFFNPLDYAKLDKSKFDTIYLLVSDQETALYEQLGKEKVTDYQIENTFIQPSKDPSTTTQIMHTDVQGSLYKLAK